MSDEEEQDNEEAQENELLALENIFDETIFCSSQEERRGGQFLACPYLPDPFYVKVSAVKKEGVENDDGENSEDLNPVKYLPPIVLNFQIPRSYPSHLPPDYTVSCKWLTRQQLTDLCHELDRIWDENKGMEILYTWFVFLQDEAFSFLNIETPLNLSEIHIDRVTSQRSTHGDTESAKYDDRGIQDIAMSSMLLPAILDYNVQEIQRRFERTPFPCKVCFNEKLGSDCITFNGCDHIYCKECVRQLFIIQISDGNIKSLTCPEEKCESQAHPSQVKELVSEELYDRYDTLLLKTSLDMMSDVTYCPRPSCQCPVLIEKNGARNMGSCPSCRFTFCVLCQLCYHGISPCKLEINKRKQLREEYLAADSVDKVALEKKYGKRTVELACEEAFSTDWLDKFSKKCPQCTTHIQKIDGCNKMTCTKCKTYFCWICSQTLSRNNPYEHYNKRSSSCFNQLFLGIDEDFTDDSDDEFLMNL